MLNKEKKSRIVFIGTPDFAVASLQHLVENDYNVVGVVTVWDKQAGRGRKIYESAVKKYAVSQNIPLLQPKNLKSKVFLEQLKAWNADIQVVVAFRMLPEVVWAMPKYGTFNLHTSLLPEYRGSAPINWVIMNGETRTGVTTFFINNKIDEGEMLLQREIPIADDEIYGDLHDKMKFIGAELVLETIDLIEKGDIHPVKQVGGTKLAPKLFIQDCDVDWSKPLNEIYNFIRGLNPYPTARTTFKIGKDEFDVQLFKVDKEFEDHNHKVGEVIVTKKEIRIATREGYINILELKFPGKKKMDTQSFLNGFSFKEKATVCNPFKNAGCGC